MYEDVWWIGSNVRYVPDLKKNFISLGGLEAWGYKFSGVDGRIKVTRGSMTILKRERTTKQVKVCMNNGSSSRRLYDV